MKNVLKNCSKIVALLIFCAGSAAVSRADTVVLTENFEGVAAGTYFAGTNVGAFEVVSGSVDVLSPAFFGSLCTTAGGNPQCVDLDGTSGGATLRSVLFPAGTYNLTFDLAGSQRGDINTTRLFLGDIIGEPFVLNSADPFSNIVRSNITVGPGGSFLVFFQEGADSLGNLLDNVVLTRVDVTAPPGAIPEPATMILLATGLAGVGAVRRRRRNR